LDFTYLPVVLGDTSWNFSPIALSWKKEEKKAEEEKAKAQQQLHNNQPKGAGEKIMS
jgi:hypothetical protein